MSSPDPFSSLSLPSDPSAPAVARRHSREVLDSWNLRGLLEPVLLVVSELVTNAVRHGRPPVSLGLRRGSRDVRIEVRDAAPGLTERGEAADDAESGRGLQIVRAVSTSSGVDYVPDDGKVTWARVDEPEPDDQSGD